MSGVSTTNDTSLIAEKIAAGDLKVEVGERSGNDRLMRALNRMIERLNDIMNETTGMIQTVNAGSLDVRGNAGKFEGGWRELVTGMNELIFGLSNAVSTAAALSHEMDLARQIQTALLPGKVEHPEADLEEFFEKVIASEPSELTVDIRNLEYLNSSGIKTICVGLLLEADEIEDMQMKILCSNRYTWQKETIPTFEDLVDHLEIRFE